MKGLSTGRHPLFTFIPLEAAVPIVVLSLFGGNATIVSALDYVSAAALGRDDVDGEELAEIARRHAMEVVGPPSERYG
jgi:hypothetical protein